MLFCELLPHVQPPKDSRYGFIPCGWIRHETFFSKKWCVTRLAGMRQWVCPLTEPFVASRSRKGDPTSPLLNPLDPAWHLHNAQKNKTELENMIDLLQGSFPNWQSQSHTRSHELMECDDSRWAYCQLQLVQNQPSSAAKGELCSKAVSAAPSTFSKFSIPKHPKQRT